MVNPRDRRVRKTEEQLVKGLTKLMKTKSIKNITVRELADEVDINRSTFYLHYKDIFDMVEKIENELAANLISTLDELNNNHITQNILLDFLSDTFETIYLNAELCAVLLSSNGDISFQKKLRDIIDTKTLEIVNTYLAGKASKDETVLITSFIINGILGIISTWLQNISIGTPEKMAATACSLIENGINGFYTKN
ncbi:MAG: TetR family transcriptional regulator C-terminal domain-containing protein [Oscillospiraceae bacterium]|nr:TetR family transcriptional regulator C-terminal domain-containing protein [Oscillospiraceae bacterium]MBR3535227.1 TetR family transcriptional regulator C-terminal domain-containing protein [Oscillospiraceae bacterium]MBR6923673.1 TetR family transcriptional regulator C-terminal domain-containing protein [Oscillospiraceae bacterium]